MYATHHRIALLIVLLLATAGAKAQEKEFMYEIGGGVGTSWGWGDVNPSKAVYSPSVAFCAVWRYNLNLRWVLATELQSLGMRGDTRDFDYAFPGGDYSFSTRYWQLGVRPEIHFWNYGWGSDYRDKRRYTPFMTMGFAAGVVTGGDDGAAFAWGIPMGVGFKFKVNKRLNAQLSCIATRSFSDKLDGKANPEGIMTSGLIANDWTAHLQLSVTFDFKERCVECHNQHYYGK